MTDTEKLFDIASQFRIKGTIKKISPYGDGHINDTYYVTTKEDECPDYLLQRKNKNVFHPVPDMMGNILKVTRHLQKKIEIKGGDPSRESMTIFPTIKGDYFFHDHTGEYWAMILFIPDHVIYQKADSEELAYKGGMGIGEFQSMLSDLNESLADILPGFHNIRYRFKQWDNALQIDAAGRKSVLEKEIGWIESRRQEMLDFWRLIESHVIPGRVAHNDTKINNILFDKAGNVLCIIDLDTVMNSSILNDFGDAIRTYANTGLEDDRDLKNVSMDFEIFKAFSLGYIEKTHSFLSNEEKDHLAFSARYITYEQVLRFLMDYIDGDLYYKTKSEDHNLVRTHAQFALLNSMEEQYDKMKRWIRGMI